MRHALRVAGQRGHAAVLLVGDAAYYGRFGFSAEQTGRLWLPGLGDRSRLLGRELAAGALDGVRGSLRVPKKPQRSRLLDAVAGAGRLAGTQVCHAQGRVSRSNPVDAARNFRAARIPSVSIWRI